MRTAFMAFFITSLLIASSAKADVTICHDGCPHLNLLLGSYLFMNKEAQGTNALGCSLPLCANYPYG